MLFVVNNSLLTAMHFVRVRPCCDGRCIMGLSAKGVLVVTDLWTFSTVIEANIGRKEVSLFDIVLFALTSKIRRQRDRIDLSLIVEPNSLSSENY